VVGALVALQGGPTPIQHTGELGGQLALQIYAGADAAFTLYEDDGESLDYAAARATAFAWREAARTRSAGHASSDTTTAISRSHPGVVTCGVSGVDRLSSDMSASYAARAHARW
jgi:hypothetical protein